MMPARRPSIFCPKCVLPYRTTQVGRGEPVSFTDSGGAVCLTHIKVHAPPPLQLSRRVTGYPWVARHTALPCREGARGRAVTQLAISAARQKCRSHAA